MTSVNRLKRLPENLGVELYEWVQMGVSQIPGKIGSAIRYLFYRLTLKHLGRPFKMGIRGRVQTPGSVTIGDRVEINDGLWIAGNAREDAFLSIGNDVLIGPFVVFHTGNHEFGSTDIPINRQGHKFAPIIVEDDVWIAARVTVLAGVTLGKGTVVAAGAVVTRSTEPYAIVAGVPARAIGKRTQEATVVPKPAL